MKCKSVLIILYFTVKILAVLCTLAVLKSHHKYFEVDNTPVQWDPMWIQKLSIVHKKCSEMIIFNNIWMYLCSGSEYFSGYAGHNILRNFSVSWQLNFSQDIGVSPSIDRSHLFVASYWTSLTKATPISYYTVKIFGSTSHVGWEL